ncbi:peroxisomal biogenesis factor 3 [Daktulosphaira vitifoliae]|uniref:peroxisomal biogenesis factor 3 n=1 Tax=Daktulosphaira vitifoliae TaxID=58002 RepID=UPI0021AA7138|nr:peroxisomal biogenesis factor 3 [Daktulosphaira vitifoliae]
MYDTVKKFISRHKRKLIFSGAFICGTAYIVYVVKKKITDKREKDNRDHLERCRRQQHYEATENTSDRMIHEFIKQLHLKYFTKNLRIDHIIEQLKKKNSVSLWEEMRICVFTRACLLVYAETFLVITLKIQLNLLGGLVYKSLSQDSPPICSKTQEDYLSLFGHFIEDGIQQLEEYLKSKVFKYVQQIPIQEQYNLQDLEKLFYLIQTDIASDSDSPFHSIDSFVLHNVSQNQEALLQDMVNETKELLKNEEIISVARYSTCHSFNKLMDTVTVNIPNQSVTLPTSVQMPFAKWLPILDRSVKVAENGECNFKQEVHIDPKVKVLSANVYEAFCSA